MSFAGKITNLFADKAMTIPAFPRTKVKAVSDDNGVGLNALLDAKQKKHIATSVTLLANGWSNNQQIVNLSAANSTNTLIVCSAPDNLEEYANDGVYCLRQGNGQLVFACTSVPKIDLVANIMILN